MLAPVTSEPERPQPGTAEQTEVGNYFVANYPPFAHWTQQQVPAAVQRLAAPPAAGTPFGLYVHIPFCRKRCDFCYFRVYTDKNSDDIRRYLDAVLAETARYAETELIRGRKPGFVYFGGGTPSYLSVAQLEYLFEGLQSILPWDAADEVTFECEPGTLQEPKVHWLRQAGVTRLSLGVENFDAQILEWNNRAHRATEIDRAYGFVRDAGFPQCNIDLIAGMVGETDDNWRQCIERTIELAPESVTIYQMEVPYNTTIYRRMKDGGESAAPVADWATKRRWVGEAFAALEAHGYEIGSAYTAKKVTQGEHAVQFRYRDGLWHGADLLGVGVASFGHLGGVHVQNAHDFEPYLDAVEGGSLPLHRAMVLDDDARLIREFVLQLKLGRIDRQPFLDKFGVDVLDRFGEHLRAVEREGHWRVTEHGVELSRDGLLQVDRLLHGFFRAEHRGPRYA